MFDNLHARKKCDVRKIVCSKHSELQKSGVSESPAFPKVRRFQKSGVSKSPSRKHI